MLKFYNVLFYLFKSKFERYNCIHFLGHHPILKIKTQILHIDDPTYTEIEKYNLKNWENLLIKSNLSPVIITTNNYTRGWLSSFLTHTRILVIEQGYNLPRQLEGLQVFDKNLEFSCVYSSPYIHVGSDKHANHDTWGAELLIERIIPEISLMDSEIFIHLIGEVGQDAAKALQKYKNVFFHGRVNFEQNISLIAKCSIGIYPRNKDYKRSMSKIFSYIGAGLPVVTFDLVDTEVIKVNSLGFSVTSVEEFVSKILYLKNNPELLQSFKTRVNNFRSDYTWQKLSNKMENYF
jgi:glycosyltransferase involved in cell wall biosynthesis